MCELLIWLLCGLLTGGASVWVAKTMAMQRGWLDIPNERSLHTRPTPRIGGFGILAPVLLGILYLSLTPDRSLGAPFLWILIPSLCVAAISFVDDLKDLPHWLRMAGHAICAAWVLYLFRATWMGQPFPVLGSSLPFFASALLLFLWLVGLTNAYNFMDGIDGIASIQGLVAVAGWCSILLLDPLLSVSVPHESSIIMVLLFGGLLGFLFQNWAPAKIFMGDIGSTFLGFFLAAVPVGMVSLGLPLDRALEAGLFFVWPFVADSGTTFIRRLIARDRVFEPHRTHLYQRLTASFDTRESGHRMASLIYGLLALVGVGLFWTSGPLWAKLVVLLWLWLAVSLWIQFMRTVPKAAARPVSAGGDYDLYLAPPEISSVEREFVNMALDSGYIAPVGPQVNTFETELSHYLGYEEIQAVNSGTAAIHLGLRALGVLPGDCVLCPDLTFVASVNPVRYLGAEPVLIDVNPDNWAMDLDLAREAIRELRASGKTVRAMVIVHAYGIPAPMESVMKLASEEGILVLEDCAGAFGSTIGQQSVGTFGDAAAFSFNGNKVLTTSGGGALYVKDPALRSQARSWANQGKLPGAEGYSHDVLGYNYRLSNISAAIGIGQLQSVEKRLKRKEEIFNAYRDQLSEAEGFHFMPSPLYGKNNYWLSCLGTGSAEQALAIVESLQKDRIEAVAMWKPMHLQEVNTGLRQFGGAVSSSIYSRFLSLPSGTQLRNEDIQRICRKILES